MKRSSLPSSPPALLDRSPTLCLAVSWNLERVVRDSHFSLTFNPQALGRCMGDRWKQRCCRPCACSFVLEHTYNRPSVSMLSLLF